MEIKSKEDLVNFLSDLDGRIANLTETVDKLSPVEEESEEVTDEEVTEEVTDEEVNEVDKLLQED